MTDLPDLGDGLSTIVRCPTVFGAVMAKAEACVRIRESPARRLRHVRRRRWAARELVGVSATRTRSQPS